MSHVSTASTDDRWTRDFAELAADAARAQEILALTVTIPDEVRKAVLGLGEDLESLSGYEDWGIDPYRLVAMQGGTIQALRALEGGDVIEQRRNVRIGLEKVRQALRDSVDEAHIADERSTKDIVRWLVDALDASNPRVARLLGTSPRTLQRWLSPIDRAQPRGDDATRVKLVARVTDQLRHAVTSEGVLSWFESPHRALGKRAPIELLENLGEASQLIRLAATTRVSVAS